MHRASRDSLFGHTIILPNLPFPCVLNGHISIFNLYDALNLSKKAREIIITLDLNFGGKYDR